MSIKLIIYLYSIIPRIYKKGCVMQKKILAGVTFSIVILMSGCGGESPSPSQESAAHSKGALYTSVKSNKKLKSVVLEAAKEQGWRTTPLGDNAIVAEKFGSDPAKRTTIKIGNGVVDFDNMEGTSDGDISDLKEHIEDLISKEQEKH